MLVTLNFSLNERKRERGWGGAHSVRWADNRTSQTWSSERTRMLGNSFGLSDCTFNFSIQGSTHSNKPLLHTHQGLLKLISLQNGFCEQHYHYNKRAYQEPLMSVYDMLVDNKKNTVEILLLC